MLVGASLLWFQPISKFYQHLILAIKSWRTLKKALIDAVIRDPDLDVAAIRHHLEGLNLGDVLAASNGGRHESQIAL